MATCERLREVRADIARWRSLMEVVSKELRMTTATGSMQNIVDKDNQIDVTDIEPGSNALKMQAPTRDILLEYIRYKQLAEQEQAASDIRNTTKSIGQEREAKRRRQSYRAKNVHITKRTPTQVARDEIARLMSEWMELREILERDPTSLPFYDSIPEHIR
eukprot:GILJ01004093.1.p1 GENE.GILJ01004093.1~~GILJ01004093.1.p1  ORF type:complete len:161 (-),score=16.23 GILJ01004093.1:268-750(-)